MIPVVIGDVLRALGVPTSVTLLVVALVVLYHGQSIMTALGQLGFALKVTGVLSIGLVAAAVGFIPGVTLDVAIGTLTGWLATGFEIVATGVRVTVDALGVDVPFLAVTGGPL